MRPLELKLKNFGPYVDETVDFTRCEQAPLVLITGKTGSGKTTIFDAMCYALFNETSGKKRQAFQMRSDFAVTVIDLPSSEIFHVTGFPGTPSLKASVESSVYLPISH